jgi:hypothetical protein
VLLWTPYSEKVMTFRSRMKTEIFRITTLFQKSMG